MRFRTDENGQMLVLTALSLIAMLGFMALAIDVGVMFRARRNMQIAADAAAMAGAVNYLYSASTSTAATAAANAAAANGVTTSYSVAANTACPNNSQNCVVVNIPATGPTGTEPYAVEAKVSMPNPTFFMRMFGRSSMVVGARAVAASPTVGSACIWAMAPTGMGMKLQGSYGIDAPGCGVYVNSTSSNAIDVIGNGGTVNAKFVDVVGHASGNHNTNPTPETLDSPPATPPWGNVTGPNPNAAGTCSSLSTTTGNSIAATTITQAMITTAANATTNGVVCITGKNVTLNATSMPGSASGVTYLYSGSGTLTLGTTMTFGSGPTFDTTNNTFPSGPGNTTLGATLDIYQGTFNQKNSTLSMYAPTSGGVGSFNGIAIFQPSTNTNELQLQFGSGNEVLDGYIFAQGAEVYMQDSGGGVTATGIVANYIFEKTTNLIIANSYDSANPNTTLNRVVTLVE